MSKISITIVACLGVLALPITGCGGDDDDDKGASTTESAPAATSQQETIPAAVSVSIGDNNYKPQDVTIQVGQSIKWKNGGAVAHTVTSGSDSRVKFDSGNLAPNSVYALKPTTQGKITYYCTIHGKSQSGTATVTR